MTTAAQHDEAEAFLTIAEAAAILRVSYSTLHRWERAGRIEVERTPTGRRRYRRRAIAAALSTTGVA